MKLGIFIFLFLLLLFGCKSTGNQDGAPNPTRILNEDLKGQLPFLIDKYFKEFPERKETLYFDFLITENYMYVKVSDVNCPNNYLDSFGFIENLSGQSYWLFINEPFNQPERFFDLKNITIIPKYFEPIICDDFHYLMCRYEIKKENLKLEKIFSSLEYFEPNEFLSEEDKNNKKLMQKIIVEEPEPPSQRD